MRRLMNPAFSPKLIGGLVPRFQALASELIDGFAQPDRCEFVSEFAEPYPPGSSPSCWASHSTSGRSSPRSPRRSVSPWASP